MKAILKILGTAICLVLLVITALMVLSIAKAKKNARDAMLTEKYYEGFSSPAALEQKYSQTGGYDVAYAEFPSENRSIQKIRVWYPQEAGPYPMIVVVNASNTPASQYEPFFIRLASWGFLVAGNEDPQAGTGETASITLDFILSCDELTGKIDEGSIGIIGYSQGGAGALCAATNFENSHKYKAIFTGSAAYPLLARNMGWNYDVGRLSIPYFMVAGTGASDDSGSDPDSSFGGVAPLSSLVENYGQITANVAKVRARASGAEHGDILARADGYMTAWILYHLQGNEEAGTVFFGGHPELLHNKNWQDIEIQEMDSLTNLEEPDVPAS